MNERCAAPPRHRRQTGVVLVMVLWILALISVIAANYTLDSRLSTQRTRLLRDSARAASLAEAGIWRGVFESEQADGDGGWEIDGSVHSFMMDDDTVRVAVTDVGGLVDLNRAQKPLLLGVLDSVEPDRKKARELVDALLDWRDADSRPRPFGAEDDDYAASGLGYGCKNAMFSTVEELELVLGFDADLVKRLKPLLTVHSQERRINFRSAPPQVLAVIPGFDERQLAAVLAARSSGNAEAAFAIVPPRAQKFLSHGRSRTYEIRSEAVIGKVSSRLSVIVRFARFEGRPYTILNWSTDGSPLEPEQRPADDV